MKKLAILLIVIFSTINVFAQRGNYGNNFFGHLEFRSVDGTYTATLEKNIFDGLVFTDNAKNNVSFDKKYLDRHYPGIMSDNKGKSDFFRRLVRKLYRDSGYKASHTVDIFNKEIVEDNRGYRSESGKDIFGHEFFEEKGKDGSLSIKRNLQGVLEYDRNNYSASLGKDIFGKWIFSDNEGNEIQFNYNSWKKLINKFGTDKEVLWFLVDKLINDNEEESYEDYDY